MKCVYGRAGVRYVITKFSRMDSVPYFLTHVAPLRAREARAGAPLLNEMQALGRVLSQFRYLYYFWKKRLRSTNFQEDNEIALVTRRNGFAGNAFY